MSEFSERDIASFERLVKTRRSVRGFLDKRVPDDLIQRIFETARWSPSGTNVQPWHICVASGDLCERIRQGYMDRTANKEPVVVDHPSDRRVGEVWRERKRECARALYGAMNIEWEDREGRARAAFRNAEFFDAPHVAFFCMHEQFGTQSACDVGMFAQTLMLAMTAHGIASCAQGSLRNYPDFVRDTFGLDPEIKVLFGISFGYEDPSVAANKARTTRAPLSQTVQFMD